MAKDFCLPTQDGILRMAAVMHTKEASGNMKRKTVFGKESVQDTHLTTLVSLRESSSNGAKSQKK